jgi:hypothetical protein
MKISSERKKQAEIAFALWKAALANKSKRWEELSENFDELFYDLSRLELPYELAEDYFVRACDAHYPRHDTIKHVYRSSKTMKHKYDSEVEFGKSWCDGIKDKATVAFHNYFKLPFQEDTNESKRQRARAKASAAIKDYMSNFQQVDLKSLRERMAQGSERLDEESAGEDLLALLERENG